MMTPAHTIALGEARSCLAALADTATTLDASVAHEHALLDLDDIHGDYGPGIDYPTETDRRRLLRRAGVRTRDPSVNGQ